MFDSYVACILICIDYLCIGHECILLCVFAIFHLKLFVNGQRHYFMPIANKVELNWIELNWYLCKCECNHLIYFINGSSIINHDKESLIQTYTMHKQIKTSIIHDHSNRCDISMSHNHCIYYLQHRAKNQLLTCFLKRKSNTGTLLYPVKSIATNVKLKNNLKLTQLNSTQIILLGKSALNVPLAIQKTYKMVEHAKYITTKYHHMHNKTIHIYIITSLLIV